jgi:mannose-1-phosphate guanylyltransferase
MRMYALIMAGGVGTRLWPRSRAATPKQFLPLLGERTMLQQTVDRIASLVSPEQVLIATGQAYNDLVAEQLPDVPRRNIIGEPSGKGSAPCIGLGALQIGQKDPNGVMVVLSSDHQIGKPEVFCGALQAAEEVARDGYLVTLGIAPSGPHPGYGYIQRSTELGTFNGFQAYDVARFVEKPDRATAEQYLQTGLYSWNAGIFIWRVDAIMEAFAHYMPGLRQQLDALAAADSVPGAPQFDNIWEQITPITIDYGIMERAERVAVVPVDIGWSDVGDWHTLASLTKADAHAEQLEHIAIDTADTLVYSTDRKVIATVGLENFLVVDTGDALLVAPRDRAQDVKKIVDELRRRDRTDVL